MDQDRFYELLSLRLAGEASPRELQELTELLQQYPDHGFTTEFLVSIWNKKQKENPGIKDKYNRHMQRLSNHLSDPVLQYGDEMIAEPDKPVFKTRNKTLRYFTLAASLAASLVIAFILFRPGYLSPSELKAHAHNTISTKRGSKSKIILPDGTHVWLNADSRLKYDENFQGKLREVELSGEAFFDVTHDASRPFVIHTATIDVKVLGTAFNVRSYEQEKNTETSLIRGSIEVTLLKSPDKKKIILEPHDKLIVANNIETPGNDLTQKPNIPVMTLGKVSFKPKDSLATEALWTKNQLVFDNEALEDIAGKIERWYDVNVNITDEKLKKESYTGRFDNIPLLDVMEALKHSGGFRYTINNKQLTISPR
jgi:ferric-dicitrate binding protein FerR (iron transport regulator)